MLNYSATTELPHQPDDTGESAVGSAGITGAVAEMIMKDDCLDFPAADATATITAINAARAAGAFGASAAGVTTGEDAVVEPRFVAFYSLLPSLQR